MCWCANGIDIPVEELYMRFFCGQNFQQMTQIYADKTFLAFPTELLAGICCFKVYLIKCLHYPGSRSFASTATPCCIFLLLILLVYSSQVQSGKNKTSCESQENRIWQENGIKPPGISSRSEDLLFNMNFHRLRGLQH